MPSAICDNHLKIVIAAKNSTTKVKIDLGLNIAKAKILCKKMIDRTTPKSEITITAKRYLFSGAEI